MTDSQQKYNQESIAGLHDLIALVESGEFDVKVLRVDNERGGSQGPLFERVTPDVVTAKVIRVRLERRYTK